MGDRTRYLLLAMFLAVGVAGGIAAGRYLDSRAGRAADARTPPAVPAGLKSLSDSFAETADFAMKSVVHITTKPNAQVDPWGTSENVGSGVIVSESGFILTNYHVIQDARTVNVRFVDGRELTARVQGTDSESDLALLKLEPPKDLKLAPAVFGDSDSMRVGDWVLAIGSPFGYNHTVTAGIVSAKHRRADLNTPYQDFIQTDAAINPGNSGGALVNLKGEVIGINSAMVSESRRNEGVGLAISSNLAKWVLDRLMKDGRVRRGFLGISPMDLNEDLVRLMRDDGVKDLPELLTDLGLKEPRGAYVYTVTAGSPAEKAGLRDRDVIVEFNGKRVNAKADLFFKVAEADPGAKVKLRVLREKKERDFEIELAERPPMDAYGRPKRNK